MSLNHRSEIRQQIIDQVEEIVLTAVNDAPVKVYLFGSWARGEERRTSDIDVGIWSEVPLHPGLITNIRSLLEESTVPYRVDVVDLTTSDEPFLNKVKEEGIVWKG